MTRSEWFYRYITSLEDAGVSGLHGDDRRTLAPARRLLLEAEHWGTAGRIAAESGCRHAGVWGEQVRDDIIIRACLVYAGDYLILETEIPLAHPMLACHSRYFPGVERLERHLQDMFGVHFIDHPRDSRWTRHQAWPEESYPLRNDFPVVGMAIKRTPADIDYPFERIQGNGVYEIPVGPVHAGIIEPGHFRFQAVGEEILQLEERLGYTHKGIEKLAVGLDPSGLARLAGRVSGDSTVAHTWAACQAMERAAGCAVSLRATCLRALMAERERIANHLGDIGAICNDVGFAFAHVQFARLRESWQRRNQTLFGHRLMMDAIVPGGVVPGLPDDANRTLRADHVALESAIEPLFEIIDDHPSLEDRLLGTGCLVREDALELGCTGYVAKACGIAGDVRRDAPYSPYDHLAVRVPVREEGDVAARVGVRMDEIRASLEFMEHLLDELPGGELPAALPAPAANAAGLGLIESWRGEILTYVRFDEAGQITRFFARDPSWFLWPALERLIDGNIVPDFPVCNKSVNGSYSGHDL